MRDGGTRTDGEAGEYGEKRVGEAEGTERVGIERAWPTDPPVAGANGDRAGVLDRSVVGTLREGTLNGVVLDAGVSRPELTDVDRGVETELLRVPEYVEDERVVVQPVRDDPRSAVASVVRVGTERVVGLFAGSVVRGRPSTTGRAD